MSTTESATTESPLSPGDATIYNAAFWLAFAANLALTTANALTFRFAELVAYLEGSEQTAGTIVSIGVIGALVARLALGQAIDRYGARKSWITSSVCFVAAAFLFLATNRLSWEIYVARTLFAVGLAGMFTCSMVHIQNRVPALRRTEAIGALGTSGFLGMICGTQLGDLIFQLVPPGRAQFLVLFGGAAVLGLFYLGCVLYLTRRDEHDRPHETPAAHRLMFRYWPGYVVLVAIMMGAGITVITVFLTRFATDLQLSGIRTFFLAYSLMALAFRVPATRWAHTIGRHRMILLGLAGNCVGQAILPFVTRDWHFLFPAAACGFGHALLFPAVLSLGSGKFPQHFRGSGTTIVLGFTEVGAMVSAPILGWIIDNVSFSAMFWTSSAMTLVVGLLYGLTAARSPDTDLEDASEFPTTSLLRDAPVPLDEHAAEPAPALKAAQSSTAGAPTLAHGTCLDK